MHTSRALRTTHAADGHTRKRGAQTHKLTQRAIQTYGSRRGAKKHGTSSSTSRRREQHHTSCPPRAGITKNVSTRTPRIVTRTRAIRDTQHTHRSIRRRVKPPRWHDIEELFPIPPNYVVMGGDDVDPLHVIPQDTRTVLTHSMLRDTTYYPSHLYGRNRPPDLLTFLHGVDQFISDILNTYHTQ